MGKKVEIDKGIVLYVSPNYYNLPRKAKKRELKRLGKEITEALNLYIRNQALTDMIKGDEELGLYDTTN